MTEYTIKLMNLKDLMTLKKIASRYSLKSHFTQGALESGFNIPGLMLALPLDHVTVSFDNVRADDRNSIDKEIAEHFSFA